MFLKENQKVPFLCVYQVKDTILDTKEEVPRQLNMSAWSSDFRITSAYAAPSNMVDISHTYKAI